MQKYDIWISDLSHTVQGITNRTFPLGASFIYSYAKQELSNEFDFKLFKFPNDLAQAMNKKLPTILAFSNYIWNFELAYKFASIAKLKNPNLVTVFGGPNFPTLKDEKSVFLKERPAIDFYIELEGELGFVDLVNKLVDNNLNASALKKKQTKINNTCYFFEDSFTSGPVERIKDINIIPSPYLTGAMDYFFDHPLVPLIETTRGCPFTCTFCADGLAEKSKVIRRDFERTKEELIYIAKRVKNINELMISDLNFGMYKQDLETAKMVSEIQKEYNYPSIIDTPAGKNMPERTIQVASTMKGWLMGGSIQSTDPDVLRAVKRSNISLEAYKKLMDFGNKRGRTYSEIILGLPEDTKEKHYESLRFSVDNYVNSVHSHQSMLLPGTEQASSISRKKFALKTMFRTSPGNVGEYEILGEKHSIAEMEEIVVGSSSLSKQDYLDSRVMDLIVKAFYNNSIFDEAYSMVRALKVSPFDCLIYIQKHPELYSKKIDQIFKSYIHETMEDLFDSREKANEYVLSPQNINSYINGKLGTNELTLHNGLLLNEFEEICDLTFKSIEGTLNGKGLLTEKIKDYIDELKKFTLFCKSDLFKTDEVKSAKFKYDFDAISKENYSIDPNDISSLKIPLEFKFFHDSEQQKYISNAVKMYSKHSSKGQLFNKSNMKQMYRNFYKTDYLASAKQSRLDEVVV
jgi:radical SAM superfamily enzyme YgiQ (UPF0313 family)